MISILDYVQTEVYTINDGTTHIRARLVADFEGELPAPTGISGFTLEQGSTAIISTTGDRYMLSGGGAWFPQRSASIASLVNDISALQSDMQIAENQIGNLQSAAALLIDRGAKNLLEMTHADGSATRYGVTCSWSRADGTLTLTGSHAAADSTAIFEFYSGAAADQRQIEPGSYHLAGVPAGGSTSTYRGALTSITGAVDTGSGADFSITSSIYLAYRILVSGTVDFGAGKVFMPIVCPSEYWQLSQKIVPYAPTNRDIYLAMQ